MKETGTKRAMILRRIFSAFALVFIVLGMAFSPSFITEKLNSDVYRDWMQTKTEPKVLIIEVWHIVSFKPCVGSLGSWLKTRSDEYKKTHIGIHFNVRSMTPEDAESELSRGLRPDVISFMSGTVKTDELLELTGMIVPGNDVNFDSGKADGKLYALPYCASGKLLLYDPSGASGISMDEISSRSGTVADFKAGKAISAVCDIRETGDLYRAGIMGKAPYFEAVPLDPLEKNDLVQYLGIALDIAPDKLEYALGFIDHVLKTASQDTLCGIGLMPVDPSAKAEYEYDWLDKLRSQLDTSSFADCFAE